MRVLALLMQNEYIKLALAVGIVCIAAIFARLLLRSMKLWYWKTEDVLDALDTISCRLETVEEKLNIPNHETRCISEDVNSIGAVSRAGVVLQEKLNLTAEEIAAAVKESKDMQGKMAADIAQVQELLIIESKIPIKHQIDAGRGAPFHVAVPSRAGCGREAYSFGGYDDEACGFDVDPDPNDLVFMDDTEDFWAEDEQQDFLENEDEIRSKIRL